MLPLQHRNGHNCKVQFVDGTESAISSKELFQKQLHRWKDWSCEAGFSNIYVYTNGDVYTCESRNNYLGSIDDGSFSLLSAPTVCKMSQCSNNPKELQTKKFKINTQRDN